MAEPLSLELARMVEQFLYREARLLDAREFEEWLGMFAPDATYEVPSRSVPLPVRGSSTRPVEEELSPTGGLHIFDENTRKLAFRVAKLRTGKAWAEDPPSRTRRFITNVEIERTEDDELLRVYSNLQLYRSRYNDRQWLVGQRCDLLRQVGESFLIQRRHVVLDDTVLPVGNLSLFL
jgi:3-phenylpropionate/cinnamic acid dioxygenase small subunit